MTEEVVLTKIVVAIEPCWEILHRASGECPRRPERCPIPLSCAAQWPHRPDRPVRQYLRTCAWHGAKRSSVARVRLPDRLEQPLPLSVIDGEHGKQSRPCYDRAGVAPTACGIAHSEIRLVDRAAPDMLDHIEADHAHPSRPHALPARLAPPLAREQRHADCGGRECIRTACRR